MGTDPTPSDAELLARAKAGEEVAFRMLHDRHAARLRARVRRRLPPVLRRRLAESDVLQEAFAEAFEGIGRLQVNAPGAFAKWLDTIADRKAIKAVRRHLNADKRGADREISRGRRAETGTFVASDATPSEVASARELDEALARTVERLPEDYREVLHLVHEMGLSLAEAAKRMGRSADATRKLYGRAVNRLGEGVFGEDAE
jgi:RNA polymerase sigma-70 factor (subfamily 1)